MKWSWLKPGAAGPTKKLHVKVRPLKLEGLRPVQDHYGSHGSSMVVVLKMKWKGPRSRSGLVPFSRATKTSYSSQKFLMSGQGHAAVEWDDEFESVCDFRLVPSISKESNSFGQWFVSFKLLLGEEAEESGTKLEVLGTVTVNVGEMASTMALDSQIQRKLPFSLRIGEVATQVTLQIGLSFAEVRDGSDLTGIVQTSSRPGNNDKEGTFKMVNALRASVKKKDRVIPCDNENQEPSPVLTSPDVDSAPESSSRLPDTVVARLESSRKSGPFSWKNRRMSFRLSRRKGDQLMEKIAVTNKDEVECGSLQKDESCSEGYWGVKELLSRDGSARLKANVFFASFDQRSEKAAGESACTALVAAIADWFLSNPEAALTLKQFESLITEGSLEWRKLCDSKAYSDCFPDNHFDLETVLKAGVRPFTILREKSYTGIFSPEKFENLKGAMSFDEIWKEISSTREADDQKIYIVSWNDHFFVLKVDAGAYYIIDTLGERLFEGCNQAYILKFDDSSLMHGKVAKEEDGSEELAAEADKAKGKGEREEIICEGKECCGEFIKRFFASIPLGDLEVEEKKGKASTMSLLQRLQIDFHYCSSTSPASSSSSSSSLTSSPSSLFSSEEGSKYSSLILT